MRDAIPQYVRSRPRRRGAWPHWAFLLLLANGLLLGGFGFYWTRSQTTLPLHPYPQTVSPEKLLDPQVLQNSVLRDEIPPSAGPRMQLSYDRWVSLLYQEATALASSPPENLSILAGDSLSLWFPERLLPKDQTWLNQGISGETSEGLRKRLDAWATLYPKRVFVLIGINDLLRGQPPANVLDNQRLIIQQLKQAHPRSKIIVQSLLPHRGPDASWEGRDRLMGITNEQIRSLNRALKAVAQEEGVHFLNLHPLFADASGYLRRELTTDGLHLNPQGYLVWSTAIELFTDLELRASDGLVQAGEPTVEQQRFEHDG